jgi:hypothetical protein
MMMMTGRSRVMGVAMVLGLSVRGRIGFVGGEGAGGWGRWTWG